MDCDDFHGLPRDSFPSFASNKQQAVVVFVPHAPFIVL